MPAEHRWRPKAAIADIAPTIRPWDMPSPRPTELITPRLRLRRPRAEDVRSIHAIMADPEVMKYWSSLAHASLEETSLWFDGMLSADRAFESDEFVIEYCGEVVGKMGAWRMPEIGFYLHPDFWGQGIAAEALCAFVDYARSRGEPHLLADVDPRNTASLTLLEKYGFREYERASATYIVGDQICDSVYLRLDLSPQS